jgi:hypothetical protein
MSQSSGFLRELEEELADEATNDARSPSVSSSGEVAVSSLPPEPTQNERNATKPSLSNKRKEACSPSEATPSNDAAAKRLTSCRRGYAAGEDAASGIGQCTHEVIYRGLCGMCVPLSCAVF